VIVVERELERRCHCLLGDAATEEIEHVALAA
jgi:hypothetical protein